MPASHYMSCSTPLATFSQSTPPQSSDLFSRASLPNKNSLLTTRINQLTRILDGKSHSTVTTDFGHVSITKKLLGYLVEHCSLTGIKTVYQLDLTGRLLSAPNAYNGIHETPLYQYIDEVLSMAANQVDASSTS